MPSLQEILILSVGLIAGQRRRKDGGLKGSDIAIIPVPDSIEFDVSQIGSVNLGNNLVAQRDFTLKIVRLFLFDLADLDGCTDLVLLIDELYLPLTLNLHAADKGAGVLFLSKVVVDFLPVLEYDVSIAPVQQAERVQTGVALVIVVTIELVAAVRPDHIEIGDRGVVADLLAVQLRAIWV